MGSDVRSEQTLLQELRTLAGPHAARIRLCDDLSTCDLLVLDETSAMRAATLRLAAERPTLRTWLRDPVGTLRAANDPAQRPLDHDAIARTLAELLEVAPPEAPPEAPPAPPVRDDGALLARLQALPGRTTPAMLRVSGRDTVLYDPATSSAILLEGNLEALGAALGSQPQSVSLSDHDAALSPDAGQGLPRMPLASLLWQLGRHAAGDGLHWHLPGLGDGVPLRLHKWPDVRLLAHRHDDFRLCSILVRQPATPLQCVDWLGLEPALVRIFFHGACLSGYASPSQPEAVAAAREPRRRLSGLAGLWRTVRQRIGG
ncbi:MAG: hypothetical protein KIS72_09770 [Luteimonas sp.]|nr:hypothetical protein [Luteimonas sp.]